MVLTGKKARKQLISRPLSGFDYALKKIFFRSCTKTVCPIVLWVKTVRTPSFTAGAAPNLTKEVIPHGSA